MEKTPQPAPPEMTFKAVALGLFLAFVFGSANAYLGMRAGQTVAATIPAAVIAMALFRIPAFRGNLLEQNITRTAASVGEALVAGAIFTIPAFMMVEIDGQRLWTDLRSHYWEATLVLLVGGLIGVFFIILLRRPLCVDAKELPWPESVASYEIVKSGEKSAGNAARYIFGAMGFGGLIQILTSDKGAQLFRDSVSGFLAFPKSLIHYATEDRPLADVTHFGGIPWTTPSLSPALMGIGYIIGPQLSAITVAGGVLAWWVLIPLLLFFDPDFARRIGATDAGTAADTVWHNVVRPIAVGMMLVGAGNTLFSMRASLWQSLRGVFTAAEEAAHEEKLTARTEQDIPARWVVLSTAILLVPITAIYYFFTKGLMPAIVAAVVMTITGFLLCAIGGYLVGLVGSSNQPLSGLTLSALIIAALMMLVVGVKGLSGVAAVLGVAAVVCVACSVSGSLIQDLKAGHLLQGTPWKMELVEIISVVLLAFFLMFPIIALHEANLSTGGIGGSQLPAPQAGLMALLAKGIVSGQMAWGLLGIGAAFGFALVFCGARSPMLVAVGMYLPFETSSAIFVGGLMKWIVDQMARSQTAEQKLVTEEKGTLLASGLIAGEAIVGILLAVVFLAGVPAIATFSFFPAWGSWLSLIGFAAIGYVLVRIPTSKSEQT